MNKDLYLEKVISAKVENGIVTIGCGVDINSGLKTDVPYETARLRIPLPLFQPFATRFRDILVRAMEDGWYGEDGKKAAKSIKGSD